MNPGPHLDPTTYILLVSCTLAPRIRAESITGFALGIDTSVRTPWGGEPGCHEQPLVRQEVISKPEPNMEATSEILA
jgi:hypothetical protein